MLLAKVLYAATSKEAPHANRRPPPRPTARLEETSVAVPLDRLWDQLPQTTRELLLTQLTRALNQRLSPVEKEKADE